MLNSVRYLNCLLWPKLDISVCWEPKQILRIHLQDMLSVLMKVPHPVANVSVLTKTIPMNRGGVLARVTTLILTRKVVKNINNGNQVRLNVKHNSIIMTKVWRKAVP
jgi:hypothetical protein